MGIFSLIKKAVPSTRIVNIDASLGNVLLAGTSPRGMEMIMRNYAIDSLNNNAALVIFRDAKNGYSSYPSITTSNSMIYEINNEEGAISEQIDPFSCFSDSETNTYLINMFDSYSEIDKSKRMSYQNYIALLRSLLKKRGRTVKLNEYINYSFEEVERLNATLSMPETERNRNERFLNSFLPCLLQDPCPYLKPSIPAIPEFHLLLPRSCAIRQALMANALPRPCQTTNIRPCLVSSTLWFMQSKPAVLLLILPIPVHSL